MTVTFTGWVILLAQHLEILEGKRGYIYKCCTSQSLTPEQSLDLLKIITAEVYLAYALLLGPQCGLKVNGKFKFQVHTMGNTYQELNQSNKSKAKILSTFSK